MISKYMGEVKLVFFFSGVPRYSWTALSRLGMSVMPLGSITVSVMLLALWAALLPLPCMVELI